MADAVAQPFVNTFTSFDRFDRKHVGVGGDTLMGAWRFPHAADLRATPLAFGHVKPQEEAVADTAEQLSAAWATRLGHDGGAE